MEVDVGRPAAAFEHELASKDMTNGRRACVSWCVPKRVPKAGKHGGEVPEAVEYALLARSTSTKNRTEVLCPRVTQAAMIAAASFGLRRSGRFATATSGAAYWAASVRHGPPWPLPVNAPKSIFQNSIRAANLGGWGRELRLQSRPFQRRIRAIGLGRVDHVVCPTDLLFSL
jgi:hypothetical protein